LIFQDVTGSLKKFPELQSSAVPDATEGVIGFSYCAFYNKIKNPFFQFKRKGIKFIAIWL
jgi:hypothetical protein